MSYSALDLAKEAERAALRALDMSYGGTGSFIPRETANAANLFICAKALRRMASDEANGRTEEEKRAITKSMLPWAPEGYS